MIADGPIIHFSPADAPDLPELHNPKELQPKKRRQRKRDTPPPTDWQPIGDIW